MANVECPKCGEIVRSDLLTCWSCGTKFQLSETFTGVSKVEEPPIDEWRDQLANRNFTQESLEEVKREFTRRQRRPRRITTGSLSKVFNFLAVTVAIVSVIAIATSGYFSFYKGVPLKRALNYATSEYYRYGYDSVANINSFVSSSVAEMNKTIEGFNEWSDGNDQIETPSAPNGQYDRAGCIALMKLRAMLILVNNVGSTGSVRKMSNTERNRDNFVRGCLDASRD